MASLTFLVIRSSSYVPILPLYPVPSQRVQSVPSALRFSFSFAVNADASLIGVPLLSPVNDASVSVIGLSALHSGHTLRSSRWARTPLSEAVSL